jgi:uncharacterized protein (TIGR02996 family)
MAKKRTPDPAAGFLREVIASPDDDAPRLVFADWLEDHGETHRAEFIRLQCRLARAGEDDPGRADLLAREWELQTVCGGDWRPAFPAWARDEPVRFRRGFAAWTSTTATRFLRHGEKLFAAAPIEGLQLRGLADLVPEVFASPLLARLHELDLNNNVLSGADVEALCASRSLGGLTRLNLVGTHLRDLAPLAAWKQLGRIRSLDLAFNPFPGGEIWTLVGSPHLTALTHLNLTRARLNGQGVASLAAAKRLAGLTHLGLAECGLTAGDVRVLGSAAALGRLASLDLRSNPLDAGAMVVLANSPLLGQLSELNLSSTNLGPQEAEALAGSPHLGNLRRLKLTHNSLRGEAARALASAPFARLGSLELDFNGIDASGAGALAQSPHLSSLRSLSLYRNPLGPDGARALAASPRLAQLTSLHLGACDIDAGGAAALAASECLAGLTHLDLSHNPIGSGGVIALAASPHLANLHTLNLAAVGMDDRGMRALATSPHLGWLRKLVTAGNPGITPDGRQALRDSTALPRLIVLSMIYGHEDHELAPNARAAL